MEFDVLETSELVEVIENLPPSTSYWLDLAFPRAHYSQSEFIDFDLVDKARRLAPFVAPNVQGKPMLQRRRAMRRFKPAYIKMKDPVDPTRLFEARAGEPRRGNLTPQQRADAITADILKDHRDALDLREEWMAAKAVQDGQVTVVGEDYPEVTVGFGRKPSQTKILTGNARWGQAATATPIDDIRAWSQEMLTNAGMKGLRLTMGVNASAAFFNSDQVQAKLETRRGSLMQLETGSVDGDNVVDHGVLPGGIRLVTYNEFYEDNLGNQVPFLDPDTVILTGNINGIRCYGAIQDFDAQWQSLRIFSKMFKQQDPSGLFIMDQSAPLPIPAHPNASTKVDVIGV